MADRPDKIGHVLLAEILSDSGLTTTHQPQYAAHPVERDDAEAFLARLLRHGWTITRVQKDDHGQH